MLYIILCHIYFYVIYNFMSYIILCHIKFYGIGEGSGQMSVLVIEGYPN